MKYRNLYYLEYLGPFLLPMVIFYMQWEKFNDFHYFVAFMLTFHFGKRLWESKFVHLFSNATVPVSGAMKNFIIYWFLVGLAVPYELFVLKDIKMGPCWFPCRSFEISCFVGFMICEILNGYCHWELRKLRVKNINGK